MAKTKRTVEEAEVAAAAAANSDSKLITPGSLNRFATKFWDKIKDKYDVTFKAARITDEKKLIFTKTKYLIYLSSVSCLFSIHSTKLSKT